MLRSLLALLPFLLAVALGLLLVRLLFSRQRADYKKHVQQLQPKGRPGAQRREMQVFTRAQVGEHNKRADAWVVIKHKRSGENRVYDLTAYIDQHPGGDSILNNVGGDSSEGFHGPQHPDTVFVLVEDYCIGTVKD